MCGRQVGQVAVSDQSNLVNEDAITIFHSQKRFNKKEKVEERLEKKLKEFEEQSKKLKEQVGELEHRLSVECDENQGSKQEIDVLKDCLMQLQVRFL